MCEKQLTIFFGKILLLLENGIFRNVSSMPGLCPTKATQGSLLVGYLSKYHPYIFTLNGMSEYSSND